MLLGRVLIVTTIGLLALAVVGPAAAESEDERGGRDDDLAGATAPVALDEAIATAEGVTGGRTVSAGYGFQDGALVVEVDLVKDQSVLEVLVDSGTGAVVAQGNRSPVDREDDDEGGGDG